MNKTKLLGVLVREGFKNGTKQANLLNRLGW